MHAHEHASRRELSPDFLPVFARAMIVAGADVFVTHGPHVLRGIGIVNLANTDQRGNYLWQ